MTTVKTIESHMKISDLMKKGREPGALFSELDEMFCSQISPKEWDKYRLKHHIPGRKISPYYNRIKETA